MIPTRNALPAGVHAAARRAGARLYGCHAWLVFIVLLLVFGMLAALAGRVDRARRLARAIARLMFRLAGIPLTASGVECLPTQTHILLANHTSFLDAILLTALLPAAPGYAFTTRRQHLLQGLLWPFLRCLHTLVLKQHGENRHSDNIDILAAALKRGDNLVVFPEGGFVPEPGLKPFHSGAFVAAARMGVPIVVVGLHGTRQALRLGTWMPKRLPLAVEVGPVLMPCGTDAQAIHALMVAAHEAMLPLTGETCIG